MKTEVELLVNEDFRENCLKGTTFKQYNSHRVAISDTTAEDILRGLENGCC